MGALRNRRRALAREIGNEDDSASVRAPRRKQWSRRCARPSHRERVALVDDAADDAGSRLRRAIAQRVEAMHLGSTPARDERVGNRPPRLNSDEGRPGSVASCWKSPAE